MTAPASIVPLPWQTRMLHTPEVVNLFLGGGRGGGKSTGAALVILRYLTMYGDRAKALVLRPDSYKGTSDFEDQIEDLLIAGYGAGRVNRNRGSHTMRVESGGSVEFSALDSSSTSKFQGRQFGLIIADEAGNFSTLRYLDRLRSNLRTADGVPTRLVIVANPGGPAHTELGRRYVHGRVAWHPFMASDGELWVYVPSTLNDNAHLDREGYTRRLRAACGNDSALLEAWLSGSWSAISGAFFSDVLSDSIWLPTFTPEEWAATAHHWDTMLGIDWGMSAPSVALFGARARMNGALGPGGRSYSANTLLVLDELNTCPGDDPNEGGEWPPQMLAEAVIERCSQWNVNRWGVVDDARGLDGSTLIEQFRRLGLSLRRPVKDRISGWVRLKAMMAATRDSDPDHPSLYLSARCRYLAETLPTLLRNPLRPEDITASPKQADHGADALRYLAAHERHTAQSIAAPHRVVLPRFVSGPRSEGQVPGLIPTIQPRPRPSVLAGLRSRRRPR